MRFSVNIQTEENYHVITLKDDASKTEATIFSFGALLNYFLIDGKQNIIDGFPSLADAKKNITNGFKSAKLSPFVCRIEKGEYNFKEKKYKTGKHFLKEEAIHGLLYDEPFIILNSNATDDESLVQLQYNYIKKIEGFLFEFECIITYTLQSENKLTLATTIINKSFEEMPLADGWHPYFKFDQKINDLLFSLNADKILEFNDRLLPTGKILPFDNFQSPQKLEETFFDNCFVLNDTNNVACVLNDEQNKLKLEIYPSELYSYLQVYTPPHRTSIAIENLSAAPDAFNNQIGLIILRPAESRTFSTTYKANFY